MESTDLKFITDKKYWDEFYANNKELLQPSSFAVFCLNNYLNETSSKSIIEFGCGNGRDSFFFASKNCQIVGVDNSSQAIESNMSKLRGLNASESITFKEGNFEHVLEAYKESINVIYSRFTMHAVTEDIEDAILNKSYEVLPEGGFLMTEFRTINDPLMQNGQKIGTYERITTHYRRFIDSNVFLKKCLNLGFTLNYFIEKNNLSVYKDDNPVLVRLILQK